MNLQEAYESSMNGDQKETERYLKDAANKGTGYIYQIGLNEQLAHLVTEPVAAALSEIPGLDYHQIVNVSRACSDATAIIVGILRKEGYLRDTPEQLPKDIEDQVIKIINNILPDGPKQDTED